MELLAEGASIAFDFVRLHRPDVEFGAKAQYTERVEDNAFHLVRLLAAIHTNESYAHEEDGKKEIITTAENWAG